MNRREFVISTLGAAATLYAPVKIFGQKKAIEPDLGLLADGKGVNPSNRTITRITDGARKGIRLSEAEGEWPVYFPGIEFSNGTIEFDVKGKDVQGASFVGVAFHGVDGKTYDGIYFRPFNFKTDDQAGSFAPSNTSPIRLIRGRSCAPIRRGSTRSLSSPCRTRTAGSMRAWSSRARK